VSATTPLFENTYPANQSVQLHAIPATGYSFVQWKGSLTDESQASKDTIVVTMSCAKQLTAVFTPIYYKLKINIKPIEGGKLTIMPSLPADGYIAGTKVTITASANQSYKFTEWTGDFSGKDATAIVTMDKNKEVNANFNSTSSLNNATIIGIGTGIIVFAGLVIFLVIRKRRIPPQQVT